MSGKRGKGRKRAQAEGTHLFVELEIVELAGALEERQIDVVLFESFTEETQTFDDLLLDDARHVARWEGGRRSDARLRHSQLHGVAEITEAKLNE